MAYSTESFLVLSTKKNTFYCTSLSFTHNSRSSCKLSIEHFKIIIYKTRNIELEVSKTATIRKQKYINKWQPKPIT